MLSSAWCWCNPVFGWCCPISISFKQNSTKASQFAMSCSNIDAVIVLLLMAAQLQLACREPDTVTECSFFFKVTGMSANTSTDNYLAFVIHF